MVMPDVSHGGCPSAQGEDTHARESSGDDSDKDKEGCSARRVQSSSFTQHSAVEVYLCRPTALGTRSLKTASLARSLGERYGVTSKAIRHVWNRRSWAWATRPHWTPRELQEQLQTISCVNCRARGVTSFEEACATCAAQEVTAKSYRRRGRPAGKIFQAPAPHSHLPLLLGFVTLRFS